VCEPAETVLVGTSCNQEVEPYVCQTASETRKSKGFVLAAYRQDTHGVDRNRSQCFGALGLPVELLTRSTASQRSSDNKYRERHEHEDTDGHRDGRANGHANNQGRGH
jgi:hypothetical protein